MRVRTPTGKCACDPEVVENEQHTCVMISMITGSVPKGPKEGSAFLHSDMLLVFQGP